MDIRRIAIAVAAFAAFVNLYATQSVLPLLMQEFDASAAAVSLTVSATTFAVALVAPFVGVIADVAGRKRIIVGAIFALAVPTALIGLSGSLEQLIAWRFVQGLLLPPIFAVTVAYIGEEWPTGEVAAVTGLYTAGGGLGGFFGRFQTGLIGDHWGWRYGFVGLALLTLACGVIVLAFLRRERGFVRAASLRVSARQMTGHLRAPALIATFAVGFTVLFVFVATFTYVNFYLHAPPFGLSPAALGSIFLVYLLGVVVTPWTGRLVARFGRRRLVIMAAGIWGAGELLTLSSSLGVIIVGLAVAAGAGFLCQATSMSYLMVAARQARSSAVGLYVTCYYVGGSVGGVLPGLAWQAGGWPACLAMTGVVLALMAAIVARFWAASPSAAGA